MTTHRLAQIGTALCAQLAAHARSHPMGDYTTCSYCDSLISILERVDWLTFALRGDPCETR